MRGAAPQERCAACGVLAAEATPPLFVARGGSRALCTECAGLANGSGWNDALQHWARQERIAFWHGVVTGIGIAVATALGYVVYRLH
jgi:hypothetical protein